MGVVEDLVRRHGEGRDDVRERHRMVRFMIASDGVSSYFHNADEGGLKARRKRENACMSVLDLLRVS